MISEIINLLSVLLATWLFLGVVYLNRKILFKKEYEFLIKIDSRSSTKIYFKLFKTVVIYGPFAPEKIDKILLKEKKKYNSCLRA